MKHPGMDPETREGGERFSGIALVLLFAASASAQLPFGPIRPLNLNAAYDEGDERSFVIAASAAGGGGLNTWMTLWNSEDSLGGVIGNDFDLLYARYAHAGLPFDPAWSHPMPLNLNAAIDTGDDGHRSLSSIRGDGAGGWVAVWTSNEPFLHDDFGTTLTLGADYDVFTARSTDNGLTWSFPAPMFTAAQADSGDDFVQALETDGAGTWMALFQSNDPALGGSDGGDTNDYDAFAAISTDLGRTWSGPMPLHPPDSAAPDGDLVPQLATDRAGLWTAAWFLSPGPYPLYDSGELRLSRSTDNGATWSAPINPAPPEPGSRDMAPVIRTDGAGTWLLAWRSRWRAGGIYGSDDDIFHSRSTDGALTWSAPAPLNSNAMTDAGYDSLPDLAYGTGRWVAVWDGDSDLTMPGLTADRDIFYSSSTDGGIAWTAVAHPSPTMETDAGEDLIARAATDGQGNWLVVWTSNDSLGGTIGEDYDILHVFAPYPPPGATPTPTASPTRTPTPTATASPSPSPTSAPTPTANSSPTRTPTATPTPGGPARPPNDDFENRIPINGPSTRLAGSNINATKQAGEPNHAGDPGGASVWYAYSRPAAGTMTLRLLAPGFAAKLAVYRGNSVGGLTLVATGSFGQLPGEVTVSFPNLKDAEYVIAVDGAGGAQGSFSLLAAHQAGPGESTPTPTPDPCQGCFISFAVASPFAGGCARFSFAGSVPFTITNHGASPLVYKWGVTASGGGGAFSFFAGPADAAEPVALQAGQTSGPLTAGYGWYFTNPNGEGTGVITAKATSYNATTGAVVASCEMSLQVKIKASGCGGIPSPTPEPTRTLTPTPPGGTACQPTETPTPTPSASATQTATPTPSPSPEPTTDPTGSPGGTATPGGTPTATATETETATPTEEPTLTPTATQTESPTETPTVSPLPTPTDTETPTPSPNNCFAAVQFPTPKPLRVNIRPGSSSPIQVIPEAEGSPSTSSKLVVLPKFPLDIEAHVKAVIEDNLSASCCSEWRLGFIQNVTGDNNLIQYENGAFCTTVRSGCSLPLLDIFPGSSRPFYLTPSIAECESNPKVVKFKDHPINVINITDPRMGSGSRPLAGARLMSFRRATSFSLWLVSFHESSNSVRYLANFHWNITFQGLVRYTNDGFVDYPETVKATTGGLSLTAYSGGQGPTIPKFSDAVCTVQTAVLQGLCSD